jgi:hypothetical protein
VRSSGGSMTDTVASLTSGHDRLRRRVAIVPITDFVDTSRPRRNEAIWEGGPWRRETARDGDAAEDPHWRAADEGDQAEDHRRGAAAARLENGEVVWAANIKAD